MCSIVDYYANDIDITQQDVDLLPWNLEETKLIKEVMKSPKTTKKIEKTDKNEKENTEKERYGREDRAFAKSNPEETKVRSEAMKSPKTTEKNDKKNDKKENERYGSRADTQDHHKSADQLLVIKVEEEHKRRRDERRLKREAAKKSMPEVDVQDKRRADETIRNSNDVRRERAFLWYRRLGCPTSTAFKRQVAADKSIRITSRDIDLPPWNLTGRVVNMEKMTAMIKASILKH